MGKEKKKVMVDLECLGPGMIVQIGAVEFSWDGETGKAFLVNIDIDDLVKHGLQFGSGEVRFWLSNANLISWRENTIGVEEALKMFKDYLKEVGPQEIWSHYYDVEQFEILSRVLLTSMPFHYRQWRDIRTFMSVAGMFTRYTRKKQEKSHNALDDALYQVEYLTNAYKELKKVLKNE